MITYVDTSTLLKLIVEEDGSAVAGLIWDRADVLASATTIIVEAHAAVAAAHRGGRLTAAQFRRAKVELDDLLDALTMIDVSEGLIRHAAALAETDGLRGYDAVHLAAALTIHAQVLTSADDALCDAAVSHGLHVANPTTPPD